MMIKNSLAGLPYGGAKEGEWAQNRTGNILDKKYLEKLLRQKMTDSWQKVMTIYKEHKNQIDLRTAAYLIAIRRILDGEKLRGHLK